MHPNSRREMTFQFLRRLFVMLPPLPASIINQGLSLEDLHSVCFNLQPLLSNETVPFHDTKKSQHWATASHHLLQVTASVWLLRELLTCRQPGEAEASVRCLSSRCDVLLLGPPPFLLSQIFSPSLSLKMGCLWSGVCLEVTVQAVVSK